MGQVVLSTSLSCILENIVLGIFFAELSILRLMVSWRGFMVRMMSMGLGLIVWSDLCVGIMIGLMGLWIWILRSRLIWRLLAVCGLRCG